MTESANQAVERTAGKPAVAHFTSEVIRQRFFLVFFGAVFTGFFAGFLPTSTRPKSAAKGLWRRWRVASYWRRCRGCDSASSGR